MGRSVKIKYVITVRCADPYMGITPMAWRTRRDGQIPGYGKPNEANLAHWVEMHNRSLEPGGCNEHVGRGARAVSAKIVDQDTGSVVATYMVPLFEVVS